LRTGCWGKYLDRRGMKMRGWWRKPHKGNPRFLYSSPNITRMMMPRRIFNRDGPGMNRDIQFKRHE
jgi:hypothetical protein